jgi:lipopolysaccharide biosynthesis glycosyltransferase
MFLVKLHGFNLTTWHGKVMINVVLFTDANNLWGIAVTVQSLLENCSEPCSIYIAEADLTLHDKETLCESWKSDKLNNVEFVSIDKDKLASFRSNLYLKSKITYARLFISDYFPNLSRCLYLDTDLIVFSDVKELYYTDLAGNITGCIRDGAILYETDSTAMHVDRFRDKLGLKNPRMYFNAGVILIDLEAWRHHHIGERAVQISAEMYDVLDCLDQDILNIALEDHWLDLDVKWNASKFGAPDNFDDGILHLMGRVKPWHSDYQDRFSEQFFEVLDHTAFSGQRPASAMSVEAITQKIARNIPTLDIVRGKLRRSMNSLKQGSDS